MFDSPGGAGNCSFTDNPCLDGSKNYTSGSFSQSITLANPQEVRVLLYYSPVDDVTTFDFVLNGEPVKTFIENNPTGTCPAPPDQYPHTVTLTKDELSGWNNSGANDFTVKVLAGTSGVYIAGIVIEVVTSNGTYAWSPTTGLNDPSLQDPTASPTETTTYTVTYTDPHGCAVSDQVVVNVNCSETPIAVCTPVTVEADANCEALVDAADFDGGSSSPSDSPLTFTISPAGPYAVGETQITFTATDANGKSSNCTTTLTVTNSAPVITSVTASPAIAATNEEVSVSVSYEDNNAKIASIDWGDLSPSATIEDPGASFDLQHRYQREGTYAVAVTVTDQCDASSTYVYESIVVVSRHSGSAKGNGWFYSPRGYYVKNDRAAGKAQFQFSAAYSNRGEILNGKIAFTFRQGPLDFNSTGLDILQVDGQNAALSGSGILNKKSGYHILISMHDGDNAAGKADGMFRKDKDDHRHNADDRIRVKISDPQGSVVYDTQAGSADDALAVTGLGAGFIEILTGFEQPEDDAVASHFDEGSTAVYPNPFDEWLSVYFASESKENVNLQLMDLTGKVIFNHTYRVSEDGSYSVDLPPGAHTGLYVLSIKQGKRVEFLRLVRE